MNEEQMYAELAKRNQMAASAGGQMAPVVADPRTGAVSGGQLPMAPPQGMSVADLFGLALQAKNKVKDVGSDFIDDLGFLAGGKK